MRMTKKKIQPKVKKRKAKEKLLATPENELLTVRVPRKRAKREATRASAARSTKASARQREVYAEQGLTSRGTPRKNAGYGPATATVHQPQRGDRLFETRDGVPPLRDKFYGTANIGVASLAHMNENEVLELEGLQNELDGLIHGNFVQYHK